MSFYDSFYKAAPSNLRVWMAANKKLIEKATAKARKWQIENDKRTGQEFWSVAFRYWNYLQDAGVSISSEDGQRIRRLRRLAEELRNGHATDKDRKESGFLAAEIRRDFAEFRKTHPLPEPSEEDPPVKPEGLSFPTPDSTMANAAKWIEYLKYRKTYLTNIREGFIRGRIWNKDSLGAERNMSDSSIRQRWMSDYGLSNNSWSKEWYRVSSDLDNWQRWEAARLSR
ncbi:MAG: hypothetical protein RL328_1426 [Acidobacteriota bacterium]|jgi:hypothetical protein